MSKGTVAGSFCIFKYKKIQQKNYCRFFHPDYDRWPRSYTESAKMRTPSVAGFTASGDFHPALKQTVIVLYTVLIGFAICNYKDVYIFLETDKNL